MVSLGWMVHKDLNLQGLGLICMGANGKPKWRYAAPHVTNDQKLYTLVVTKQLCNEEQAVTSLFTEQNPL